MTDVPSNGAPGMRHFAPSDHLDHPSLAKLGITPFPDRLYVLTMLSNPLRWRSRYANYWRFQNSVDMAGAVLYTAEVAFGDRPFEITEEGNPHHLQLRTSDEVWHKENALNLLMQRLPPRAKYVAWVDADVTFVRPDWAQETLQQLQHYDFIQMFSKAQDLDSDNEPMTLWDGFMSSYLATLADPMHVLPISGPEPGSVSSGNGGVVAGRYWHPGFAWAARREALNEVGMLIDWAILGSADWHMAWGLIGQMNPHLVPALSDNYKLWCLQWQARADQFVNRNVGYMTGTILHAYHGSKAKRQYGDRWQFLIRAGFDPAVDLKRDYQGLWQLTGTNRALRDGLRAYSRARDEDDG